MDHHHLPLDILQLIYDCLDVTSRLCFRAVCRLWNSVSSLVPPPKEPPWVLFPTLAPLHGHGSYKSALLNLSSATRHKLFLPGVDWCRGTPVIVSGSHGTFLTLSSSFEHSLYDPFSGQQLRLPGTDTNVLRGYNLFRAKLSCSPSLDARRCKVVAMMSSAEKQTQLFFCRLRDIEWTPVLTYDRHIVIDDFAFHKGCLYAVDVSGNVIMSSSHIDILLIFPLWSTFLLISRRLLPPLLTGDANFTGNNYLVESGEELLLVRRLDNRHNSRDVHFQVFKLEIVAGRPEGGAVQLTELGERMLFVGRGCSMSWPAHLQRNSEFFKNNCIYFFCQLKRNQYGVGRFDLEVNICSAVLPCKNCYGGAQPVWISPPI